jgi:hypothetical protein
MGQLKIISIQFVCSLHTEVPCEQLTLTHHLRRNLRSSGITWVTRQDMNRRSQVTETNHAAASDPSPFAAMLQMIAAFRNSRAIYVAATLGLADLLNEGPKSSEELAHSTGTHAPSLYRVLRLLASAGIFAENEEGVFSITPIAATLRSDPIFLAHYAPQF